MLRCVCGCVGEVWVLKEKRILKEVIKCNNQAMYSELQITTNFTFLRGASHPEELVE